MSSMSALDSKQELPHSFDLTGKTGSFFYMAPEVANSEPYNEKARSAPSPAFRSAHAACAEPG
jgi:hypothetical protein